MKGMRNISPFGLRMPEELRNKISQMAEETGRSMNSQIILMLQECIDFYDEHKTNSSFSFPNESINTDSVQKALDDLYAAVRAEERKKREKSSD